MSEAGVKFDKDKPNVDLVLGAFARSLLEVSKVGTFGAKKYTPNGWVSVPNAKERYLSAAWRHYIDYKYVSELDPDSGLHHLSHFAWNALAALKFALDEQDMKKAKPNKKEPLVEPAKQERTYPPELNMEAQLLKAFLGL